MSKRYIDADALIAHIKNMPWKMTSAAEISKSIFLSAVEEAPTADVVEVVRCKDCKYCNTYMSWNNRKYLGCTYNGLITEIDADHYCSHGERREENEG